MSKKEWSSPPAMQIDPKKTYHATIETNRGIIEIDFFPQNAPKTVNNFVFLTREGFYDGGSFHRVISNFMIQGRDPTGTGRGGPGYRFEDEIKGNPLTHDTGVISMANAGPNTKTPIRHSITWMKQQVKPLVGIMTLLPNFVYA